MCNYGNDEDSRQLELFPRPKKRRSPPVTPELGEQIRVLYATTELAQHEIAAHFGINQGRVSEAVNKKL